MIVEFCGLLAGTVLVILILFVTQRTFILDLKNLSQSLRS